MYSAKKNIYTIAVVFLLLCAFIAGLGLSSSAPAEAAEETKVIRVAHISDMHVMIEEYCNVYSGAYAAEAKVTKLLEETPMIAEAVFEDIYNMNENAPMYIFITGDITSNGEYDNHVWLSKLYKAFTQRMRSRTDYDFSGFQIFLSPGNHDIYNCRAKSFMPSQEELDACANDEERKTLLENYDSRSVASITSKQFMDLYSDFGFCSCPDRKNGHHLPECGMVEGCSIEYFFESDYWYDKTTTREGAGLEVRTPSAATIEAFKASEKDYNIYNPDARFGACSYIARMNDFDVLTLDSNTRGYAYPKWQTEGNAAVRSCSGWHESTGGMVSEDQLRWAISSLRNDIANDKTVFTLGHTNFLPHFDSEDEVISLFTYDNWEQASYTLADAGIRYAFSGHQHASDIETYVTQKGNVFYDIETGSLSSYGCNWRTLELNITGSGANRTEDFVALSHVLNYKPFVYGIYKLTSEVTEPLAESPIELFRGYEADIMPVIAPNGYMTLTANVVKDRITGETLGIADYLAAQMYNMAGSLEYGIAGEYVGENIYSLLDGLSEKLSDYPYLQGIVNGLIEGLPNIDLCKFSFTGNKYTVSQTPVSGYDLADFTHDLAEYMMQYDFSGDAKKGLTLAKAFMLLYGGHLSGAHTDVMAPELEPLIESLQSGRFVRGVVNLLEDVLLPQLEIILDQPIRFDSSTAILSGSGFDIADALNAPTTGLVESIVQLLYEKKIIFNHTSKGYSSLRLLLADLNEVLVDILITDTTKIQNQTVKMLAELLRGYVKGLSVAKYADKATAYLSRVADKESLRSILDSELVNKYVTDAFCKNLGLYGARILTDFAVDDSDDGSRWTDGDKYHRYPVESYDYTLQVKHEGQIAYNGHTYQRVNGKSSLAVTPSAENGLLPNMITVSFNDDIYTEKKIVWFTAEQVNVFDKDARGNYSYAVPSSYIRYSVNEDMSDAVTVKASAENVDRALPTIDLGITFINLSHAHKIYNKFTVSLSGLQKGTTYYYQLGKDGAWTKTFRFATASDGEFSFMAISDIQGSVEQNYIDSAANMKIALDYFGDDPAFILSGGDNVDNGKNILQYTWLFNHQQFVWANNTLVSAAGNHEKKEHALDSVIALPDNATITADTGFFFSYDYNYAHFIVLNTNDLDEDNILTLDQESWLIEDLEANSKNDNTKWIIVLLHKGPYTAGSHAFDDDVVAMRRQLPEIFAEYGVDLVLQGHDHTYSVSEFLGGNGKKVTAFKNGKVYQPGGVLYINLGTMGDKFYDYIYSDEVDLADRDGVREKLSEYFTDDNNLELTETPVFAKITVSEDELVIRTFTILDGEVVPVDNITLTHEPQNKLSTTATIGIIGGIVAIAVIISALIVILCISKKRR